MTDKPRADIYGQAESQCLTGMCYVWLNEQLETLKRKLGPAMQGVDKADPAYRKASAELFFASLHRAVDIAQANALKKIEETHS